MSMKIESRNQNGVVILSIQGEFSINNKKAIDEALENEIKQGLFLFILDFAAVNYIDSVGISVLIKIGNISNLHQKKIVIVNAGKQVLHVVGLAKLERILTFCESINEGLVFLQN